MWPWCHHCAGNDALRRKQALETHSLFDTAPPHEYCRRIENNTASAPGPVKPSSQLNRQTAIQGKQRDHPTNIAVGASAN